VPPCSGRGDRFRPPNLVIVSVSGTPAPREASVALQRILVPFDGSRLAESVLPAAFSLAQHLPARLTLLHVMERAAPMTVHGERHLTAASEAEAYLAEVASRRPVQVQIDQHVHPNKEGDVAKSIIEHAADLEADLVILSAHGRGGARRVLFGSVAQLVLHGGTRPVLLIRPPDAIAPGPAAPWDVGRILIPLDGSAPSEDALPTAVAVAAAYGAEIHLVRIVPTLGTIPGERASAARLVPTAALVSLEIEGEEAAKALEAVASRIREGGMRAFPVVGRGEPAQGVLEAALRLRADLVVMATHGRTGLDAVLSGSVASRIAAKFPRPLLLVRSARPPEAP
jgi:nucleotide-binding universal stress UspA family protein